MRTHSLYVSVNLRAYPLQWDYLPSENPTLIRAATLNKLVEKLTPLESVEPGQSKFQTILLYTYRIVIEPRQLFEKLVERFELCLL